MAIMGLKASLASWLHGTFMGYLVDTCFPEFWLKGQQLTYPQKVDGLSAVQGIIGTGYGSSPNS